MDIEVIVCGRLLATAPSVVRCVWGGGGGGEGGTHQQTHRHAGVKHRTHCRIDAGRLAGHTE